MPQASDELRAKMEEYFGHPIDDGGPMRYLMSKGYREDRWHWRKPTGDHVPTEKEMDCLNFLVDEWDHAYDLSRGVHDREGQ